MLKRGILGLIVVVVAVLACSMAVTMAQKSATVHSVTISPESNGWKGRAEAKSQPGNEMLPPAVEKTADRKGDPAEAIAGDDPMAAVDSFLSRNRKEADDSIQALTREAEALRTRLQKIEAALARWQAVSGALNQGANPSAPPTVGPEPTPAPAPPPELPPSTPPLAGGNPSPAPIVPPSAPTVDGPAPPPNESTTPPPITPPDAPPLPLPR